MNIFEFLKENNILYKRQVIREELQNSVKFETTTTISCKCQDKKLSATVNCRASNALIQDKNLNISDWIDNHVNFALMRCLPNISSHNKKCLVSNKIIEFCKNND